MITPRRTARLRRYVLLCLAAIATILVYASLVVTLSSANAPYASRPHELSHTQQLPAACSNYVIDASQGAINSASNDIGLHCNDCSMAVTLPFAFQLYDANVTNLTVGSNGDIELVKPAPASNECLPSQNIYYSMLPYWDDLRTDCTGCGVFTDVRGIAPSRIFDIEWRATYASNQGTANFEAQIDEGSASRFSFVYGTVSEAGSGATIGVEYLPSSCWTQYECNAGNLFPGLKLTFHSPSTQASPTSAVTPSRTRTPAATLTRSPVRTATPAHSVSPTPTTCLISFSDVHSTDYFYVPVQYLYCHGIVSGYSDNTFRPFNDTTRSQLAKIDVLGFALPISTPTAGDYTFTDVPPSNPFFSYIETASAHSAVSGYTCGGVGEPCDLRHRPYFRPFANVTRSQLTKIVVVTAGWPLQNPAVGDFSDVPYGSAFYTFIETAVCRRVVSGYSDGTFRPYADATRGQVAKIVYLSITGPPACSS